MSWSVSRQGARDEVTQSAERQFDSEASRYPAGSLERQDIDMCKARALALLDALVLGEGETARVYAFGSHSTAYDKFVGCSFHVEVARIEVVRGGASGA